MLTAVIFTEMSLRGAFLIELEPHLDDRGYFARTFSTDEFEQQGLNTTIAQCNLSFNSRRGTLRGLHYQAAPHAEAKLVRCTRGAIHDVVVDPRKESETFCHWFAVKLTAKNSRMLYVPEGLAHGFLTLEDESEVFYQISSSYTPDAARGVRWDDPSFGIVWPEIPRVISERDRGFPYVR